MAFRPVERLDRQLGFLWAFVASSSIALYLVVRSVPLPGCTFRAITGVACPTCGSTRAVSALAEGHVLEALRWNPLVAVAALGFVAGGLAAPLWNTAIGKLPVGTDRGVRVGRMAMALVVVGNWIWVLSTGV